MSAFADASGITRRYLLVGALAGVTGLAVCSGLSLVNQDDLPILGNRFELVP
jgi:hypothetical protein